MKNYEAACNAVFSTLLLLRPKHFQNPVLKHFS